MGQEESSIAQPPQQPPAVTIPAVPPQTYLLHTTLTPRPQLILIGDSITELGSSHAQGWGTSLAIRYNRRLDVVNRGMNGYNSRWGAAVLPLILDEILGPTASPVASDGECIETDSEDRVVERIIDNASFPSSDNKEELQTNDAQTRSFDAKQGQRTRHPQYTFLIGFGANDSCLPDGPHSRNHVHLEEYSHNLTRMIRMIQTWNAKETAVALITPPPCDTDIHKPSRDNENVTKLYADACVQVASDMGVPVVDLWNGMQLPIAKHKDEQEDDSSHKYKYSQQWKRDYLSDGLHLTAMGNYRLYELVIEVLERSEGVKGEGSSGMGLSAANLPRSYPDHSMVDAAHPQKTFGTERR